MNGLRKRFVKGARLSCCVVSVLVLVGGLDRMQAASVYTLSDENSTVSLDLGSATGLNSWLVDSINQAHQQGFWFRPAGAGYESDLSQITVTPFVTQPVPRQLSALYSNTNLNYGVQVNYMLVGNTVGSGRSGLNETVRIYNYSSSALDFHLFQYWDLSLGGPGYGSMQNVSIAPDGALYNNARQTVTGLPAALFTSLTTPSANRAEAGLYPTTLGELTDLSLTDLNLTTAAGPGHVGWALQWDFTIGANSSVVVSTINNLQVPEPCTFALLGLALGAWWMRRRQSV